MYDSKSVVLGAFVREKGRKVHRSAWKVESRVKTILCTVLNFDLSLLGPFSSRDKLYRLIRLCWFNETRMCASYHANIVSVQENLRELCRCA